MAPSRYTLTPVVQEQICAYIRAGGYPTVAAEAAGIPKDVFAAWLAKGRTSKRRKWKGFIDAIMQASAQARLAAEMKAFSEEPIHWLKSGPGKDQKGSPGWSVPTKPTVHQDNRTVNIYQHPEIMQLFGIILQILAPYPEARAAVATALASTATPKQLPAQ